MGADSTELAVKIDVDTYQGLAHGVPRLLECLARRRVSASFYVSMGRDNSGKAVRRLFTQPGFARKMLRSNAVRLYGWRTALYGTLLSAPEIARSFPDVMRRIVADGHELGIHGDDHVHWHDHALTMTVAEAGREIDRAAATFADLVGHDALGFAAPGWQCGDSSLAAIESRPFRYQSSTRGLHPYRPRIGAIEGRLPEIPTTLPTADELLGQGMTRDRVLDNWLGSIGERRLDVLTVHAEVEGGAYLELFGMLLDHLADRARFRRLVDLADEIDPVMLPVCGVAQQRRPGRAGTVSCQML